MSRRTAGAALGGHAGGTDDAHSAHATKAFPTARRSKATRVGTLPAAAPPTPWPIGAAQAERLIRFNAAAEMDQHLRGLAAGYGVARACEDLAASHPTIAEVGHAHLHATHVIAHWTDADRRRLLDPALGEAADLTVAAAGNFASILEKLAEDLEERRTSFREEQSKEKARPPREKGSSGLRAAADATAARRRRRADPETR